jgi:hypothetical protein
MRPPPRCNGASEFQHGPLIIWNVFEHVEATDHIERPEGTRSQNISLAQVDARQTLGRMRKALEIGINPGQLQVRMGEGEALEPALNLSRSRSRRSSPLLENSAAPPTQ